MAFNDFFIIPKYRKFQAFSNNDVIEELFNYLNDKESINNMIKANEDGQPAICGVINKIDDYFAPKLGFANPSTPKHQRDKIKQLIGSLITYILSHYGYKPFTSKLINNTKYFVSATKYILNSKLIKKKVKHKQNSINRNPNEFSHETKSYIYRLLLQDYSINKMINSINKNKSPIEGIKDILNKYFTIDFTNKNNKIYIEAMIDYILSLKGYFPLAKILSKSKTFENSYSYYNDVECDETKSKFVEKKSTIETNTILIENYFSLKCFKCNLPIHKNDLYSELKIKIFDIENNSKNIFEDYSNLPIIICNSCLSKTEFKSYVKAIKSEIIKNNAIAFDKNEFYHENFELLIEKSIAMDAYNKYLSKEFKEAINNDDDFNPNLFSHDTKEKIFKIIDIYSNLISKGYSDIDLYINRASLYFIITEYQKAINDINLVLESEYNESFTEIAFLFPIYPYAKHIALLIRANIYLNTFKIDNAINDFTNFIEKALLEKEYDSIKEYLIIAYSKRANCYEIKKEFKKAIDDYTHIILLNAKYEKAYKNRAKCFLEIEEIEKANNDYKKYNELKLNIK